MGSGMAAKPEGMGLTRIWFRVGGAGWLTWKGLAAAGAEAEAPEGHLVKERDRKTLVNLYLKGHKHTLLCRQLNTNENTRVGL